MDDGGRERQKREGKSAEFETARLQDDVKKVIAIT